MARYDLKSEFTLQLVNVPSSTPCAHANKDITLLLDILLTCSVHGDAAGKLVHLCVSAVHQGRWDLVYMGKGQVQSGGGDKPMFKDGFVCKVSILRTNSETGVYTTGIKVRPPKEAKKVKIVKHIPFLKTCTSWGWASLLPSPQLPRTYNPALILRCRLLQVNQSLSTNKFVHTTFCNNRLRIFYAAAISNKNASCHNR